jgi:hypothetical protein
MLEAAMSDPVPPETIDKSFGALKVTDRLSLDVLPARHTPSSARTAPARPRHPPDSGALPLMPGTSISTAAT